MTTVFQLKVNHKGGMAGRPGRSRFAQDGIRERLNRIWEHLWLFQDEYTTSLEVQALADRFKAWYNRERRHSTLAYCVFHRIWQLIYSDVTTKLS